MKPYPAVLRERRLRFVDAGHRQAEAARTFGVSLRSISRWRQQAATGDLAPKPRPGRTPRIGPAQAATLEAQVAATPDATWPSTARSGRRRRASPSAWRPCRGCWPSSACRSNKVLFASERNEEQRGRLALRRRRPRPGALIFVDETGSNLAMTRRSGRAKRGQRVVGQVPRNPGPNVTLLAAMDQDGLLGELTMTGAVDGDAFAAYVTHILVPQRRPGDLVIWDNLSAHKRKWARTGVEAAGAEVRFLPPSSPDFNPIELAFSKVKAALRRAGARTRAELDQALTAALATVTSQDAHGWFAHGGYHEASQLL